MARPLLRYHLDVAETLRERADYSIRLLLEGAGLAAQRTEQPADANIIYSDSRPDRQDILWLPHARTHDWDNSHPDITWIDGVPFFGPVASESGDMVYGTFFLLSGIAERATEKNNFGVPIARQSYLFKQGVLQKPVVAMYASRLLDGVRQISGTGLRPAALWPDGKQYAIVLTHDVDRPYSRPSAWHYRRRIARDARAGKPLGTLRALAGYTRNVLLVGDASKRPGRDPNFAFDAWREFETDVGAKSAFYVSVFDSASAGANKEEVNYDAAHPAMVDALRRAIDGGWEVGLHASIRCRTQPNRFAEERQRLSDILGGYDVLGLRHHYWAMDPDDPEQTLRQHANAGFRYDSSLGFNDAAAFRRGMIWPFNPFSARSNEVLPIVQIPPTLMDGGIFYLSDAAETGVQQLRDHIATVAEFGGAVVLNWHLAQMNPARLNGAGPAIQEVLREIAGDSSVFWTTPSELTAWWTARRERLQNA